MPRRHAAARDRAIASVRLERSAPKAPAWAFAPGEDVREVVGEKPYRCPGCDHEIRPGLSHLVVIPDEDPGARRHWHTECRRQELRRGRGRR